MANEVWQAIVKDWRKIPAGKRDQGVKPSRVCRYDEGKTGREEIWPAVRRATKTHSAEDREV